MTAHYCTRSTKHSNGYYLACSCGAQIGPEPSTLRAINSLVEHVVLRARLETTERFLANAERLRDGYALSRLDGERIIAAIIGPAGH